MTNFYKLFILFVALILSVITLRAEVAFKDSENVSIPTRTQKVENGVLTVTYTLEECQKVTCANNGTFFIYVPGFGYSNEVGMPKVPMRVDSFRIPGGYDAELTVNYHIGGMLYDGEYEPVIEDEFDNGILKNVPVKSYANYVDPYPMMPAEFIKTHTLRGETIKEVSVSPVRYNPMTGITYVYDKIEYSLKFARDRNIFSNNAPNAVPENIEPISSIDDFISKSMIANLNDVGEISNLDTDGYEGSVGYAIVISDITGTVISTKSHDAISSLENILIDLPSSKGVYIINLAIDGKIVDSKKIIK